MRRRARAPEMAATKTPVDFVSTHLYPTDPNVPVTRDGFMDTVAAAAAVAAAAGLPILFTEFNCGEPAPPPVHVRLPPPPYWCDAVTPQASGLVAATRPRPRRL